MHADSSWAVNALTGQGTNARQEGCQFRRTTMRSAAGVLRLRGTP